MIKRVTNTCKMSLVTRPPATGNSFSTGALKMPLKHAKMLRNPMVTFLWTCQWYGHRLMSATFNKCHLNFLSTYHQNASFPLLEQNSNRHMTSYWLLAVFLLKQHYLSPLLLLLYFPIFCCLLFPVLFFLISHYSHSRP